MNEIHTEAKCPQCGVAITPDNAGGYRTFCEKCADAGQLRAQLAEVTRERDEALRKLEEATKPHASWAHIENPKVHERIPQPGDSDHHYSYEGEHQ